MTLLELEMMPDHMRCFAQVPPTLGFSGELQRLTGYSARMLFKHSPRLRSRFCTGHLLSPGKFYRRLGSVTDEEVRHYIASSNRGVRSQTTLARYPAL